VERADGTPRFTRVQHGGDVAGVLRELTAGRLPARLGITGRKARRFFSVPTVSELEALELAYRSIRTAVPRADCIVSAGGEAFLAYSLDPGGRIKTVHAGNKCASGTGEFFLQQLKRMEIGLAEAVELAAGSEPYPVAGRCSVFCKSDCTHAMNKGVEKGRISAGLARMMADKMVELLRSAGARRPLIVGGVSQNPVVMGDLQRVFPEAVVPPEAPFFEALGALLWAEDGGPLVGPGDLSKATGQSFTFLPRLQEGAARVTFATRPRGPYYEGEYLLGLDVGSTTTKAVLVRRDDHAIVDGVYLRTNGDPVLASRRCYRRLLAQAQGRPLRIVGLGITGSGRQIAGVHALSDGVVNEILAHATAAVHFDPEVETVFEIGGQDAKYTFITNQVANDYAMNEACSAGTGSFLEEACHESLGIATEDIAAVALRSVSPPNFNDQCAAFIGSDIKTAVQEGIDGTDIVAGLVYSVCQNYLNRVKGHRPVGRKIFMQGGVCYNRAVPAAMATLCGRDIVVPPDPGLMGAFGAALEVHRRIDAGLLTPGRFCLETLAEREIQYKSPFTCPGKAEGCDLKCTIARIHLAGKDYPFGGACTKYDNLSRGRAPGSRDNDRVARREELVFTRHRSAGAAAGGPTIGLVPSLLTHTFYPLYAHFFAGLGLRVVTASEPDREGMEAIGAAFCHPVVLAHGLLGQLLREGVDTIFLPHVKNPRLEGDGQASCSCPLVQGEPYVLQAAFHRERTPRIITPILDFEDHKGVRREFLAIGRQLGASRRVAAGAFDRAWQALTDTVAEMGEEGRRFLASLGPDETAVVLFGRPYNAFTQFGNLGVPRKFAGRGYKIIPHDFLLAAAGDEPASDRMYWATGQGILKVARLVRDHPNLFGVYITNFSCGPDSFILGYFRDLMGRKPSLTLELDAHTADAGIDTRIEAFLDVVRGYRGLGRSEPSADRGGIASISPRNGEFTVHTGDGRILPITDPRVQVLIPSMGETSTRGLAAAMGFAGIHAAALPPPGPRELELGKGVTTCKECLPLLLTTGSLLRYLEEAPDPDGVVVFFMPQADGPCRFGQYNVFLEGYFRKHRVGNVGLLSLTAENGYAGMSGRFTRRAMQALVIGDGLDDIQAALRTLATDPDRALGLFRSARERVMGSLARDPFPRLVAVLGEEMAQLAAIPLRRPLAEATRITLAGEIFVRRDGFSRQNLVEHLAGQGIVAQTVPIAEWLHYTDYCVLHGLSTDSTLAGRVSTRFKRLIQLRDESRLQAMLARSGLYHPHPALVDDLIREGAHLLAPELAIESSLTIGTVLTASEDDTHGAISIGPLGCMPSRITEAVLHHRLGEERERIARNGSPYGGGSGRPLPFLAIETDGTTLSPLMEARLEGFVLAAHRFREGSRARGTARASRAPAPAESPGPTGPRSATGRGHTP
jgi:predicted CoA-substrate-specific enzyme activase